MMRVDVIVFATTQFERLHRQYEKETGHTEAFLISARDERKVVES
jgi:hypothetical protein